VAFVATKDDRDQIWLRRLDESEARPHEGTDGAVYPFWSPDGRSIGFFAGGKLRKVSIAGGPPVNLCDVKDGRGGTWNRDGTIIFQPHFSDPLYRVPEGGGTPQPLTQLNESKADIAHRWPHFLPDGRHFLYYVVSTTDPVRSEHSGIHVASLDEPEGKLLLNVDSRAAYANGFLFYKRETTLMAQRFDLGRLELTGQPIPVAGNITGGYWSWGGAQFSVSNNGFLTYHAGAQASRLSELVWFDREGARLGTVGNVDDYDDPRLSHDGKKLLVAIGGTVRDLWLHDLTRDVRTRITFDPGWDTSPVWSPDDQMIVFESYRNPAGLYRKAASGTGGAEALLSPSGAEVSFTPVDWSTDGRSILFLSINRETGVDLWTYSVEDGKAEPLIQEDFDQWDARFSPDGRWIAYTSDESNRNEIYVREVSELSSKWQVSTGGGMNPTWRGDGEEIYYRASDGQMMAVEVAMEPAFTIGTPKALFDTETEGPRLGGVYDVSADGQRFLVRSTPGAKDLSTQPISLIVNWPADLARTSH
jgi:hypothetical protein